MKNFLLAPFRALRFVTLLLFLFLATLFLVLAAMMHFGSPKLSMAIALAALKAFNEACVTTYKLKALEELLKRVKEEAAKADATTEKSPEPPSDKMDA